MNVLPNYQGSLTKVGLIPPNLYVFLRKVLTGLSTFSNLIKIFNALFIFYFQHNSFKNNVLHYNIGI